MAAPTPNSSWLDDAFKSAKDDFKRSLKNPALYDFSRISTIDDVLEEATKIEKQQAKTKTLRGLTRIRPFINGLKEYSAVVEVFVQAKPDVLSLIWGPLKLILQASCSVISAFEKVVKVIADLGITLPSFKVYAQLFQSNHEIRRALCLFYADIMDFYAVLLNFLANRRLNTFLESLWPNIRSSITTIQENMEHHKTMMTMNVTLEDIIQAHRARKLALEEQEHAQVFRDSQTFSDIRNELHPHDYDADLASILRRSSVNSGRWLQNEQKFMRWLDPTDGTVRHMWLHGIPGCGKTFLIGNLLKQMQSLGQSTFFAFLCHDDQTAGDTTRVFHSIIFQVLDSDKTARPILHEASQANYRKLKSETDFVRDLLCKILKDLGPSYIVLDGLDELDERTRKHLLSSVLHITKICPETKLLISSREERDISLQLSKATHLRVDHKNLEDIVSFVQHEREDLVREMKRHGADEWTCSRVGEMLDTIAEKADGMFIYARLVLHMVQDQGTLQDIKAQMDNLPDGLDEAYGRLLTRIKSKLSHTLRTTVRTILQWVTCARRPLREEEILQVLAIEPDKADFTKGRKEFRDICKACGPIIEINESTVQFVHFSAKEYLLHEQSARFLNLPEAHVNATLVCTAYLAFSSLDTLFSRHLGKPNIQQEVMEGDYIMFEYASTAFLEHLKLSLESQDPNLETCLDRLRRIRRQDPIDNPRIPRHWSYKFKRFAGRPDLMAFLSAIAYSERKARLGLPDPDEAIDFSSNDPMNLSLARRRFRKTLESMMCQEFEHTPDCHCEFLRRVYGTKIYHCDQQSCYAYRNAFESRTDRDKHLEIHQRPCKCCVTDCLFAEVGFHDTTELRRHESTAHPSQLSEEKFEDRTSGTRPPIDTLEILKSAILHDSLEDVKSLLSHGFHDYWQESAVMELLLQLACWKASPATLSFLLDRWSDKIDSKMMTRALAVALEAANLPNIKTLLNYRADMSSIDCEPWRIHVGDSLPQTRLIEGKEFPEGISGYARALGLINPKLMSFLIDKCKVDLPADLPDLEKIWWRPAIQKATPEEIRERLDGIQQYIIWPEAFDRGITDGVRIGSLALIEFCLENGGNPNTIFEMSPIYLAIISRRKNHVEIVKLLLRYGARLQKKEDGHIGTLTGMKHIEQSFGFKWDEIVRRIGAGEDLAITPHRESRKRNVT
ncbi:hypothetical protein GGS26DRAFT_262370 [Hypomontagnella submonticulosa]|nr:hypothetical protein GGS26DRAFT_262370 [Hypomontagnella submonticulosa]